MKAFTKLIVSIQSLVLISSCTSFIDKLTVDTTPLKPQESTAGYCTQENSNAVLLGRDKSSVKLFQGFLKKLPSHSKLNNSEIMVAWSLFQMNLRPDLATPSARFQLLLDMGKGVQFWDFKDSSLEMDIPKSAPPMTFIYGLETILKTYSNKNNLRSLARLLDQYLPPKIPVSADFAKFIAANKSSLLSNELFKKSFFKAGEKLRYGESLSKLNYTKIISKYYQFKKRSSHEISTSNQLYSYPLPEKKEEEALCNVDLQKYSQSIYQITKDNRERHHPFGVKFKTDRFFLGTTSVANLNFRPLLGTYLIETTQDNTSVPICYRETKTGTHAYISFKGRDPGQYLYNLFQYNIHLTSTPAELDQFLKFPRHLILKNPIRILYESSRSTEPELDKFLEQDIPLYHSQRLGEVWLYSPASGFVLDDRGKAHLSCMK